MPKTNYCDLVMLLASVICEVHTKHYSIMIAMNDSLKTGIFSEACQNVSFKCRQQRDNFQFWPYMFMNLISKHLGILADLNALRLATYHFTLIPVCFI